jgi:hypothetical protein
MTVSLIVPWVVVVVCGVWRADEFAAYPNESGADRWFVGGVSGFMTALPLTSWWYIGIEAVPLAAEETHEVTTLYLSPLFTVSSDGQPLITCLCWLVAHSHTHTHTHMQTAEEERAQRHAQWNADSFDRFDRHSVCDELEPAGHRSH